MDPNIVGTESRADSEDDAEREFVYASLDDELFLTVCDRVSDLIAEFGDSRSALVNGFGLSSGLLDACIAHLSDPEECDQDTVLEVALLLGTQLPSERQRGR